MSTTSAYGWNIPDNTDLVKDGALAIRTLGNAIDTSMNTALGTRKAGMVLLNTTSFSAVASQSINNVFSSAYENYKIVITGQNTTGQNFLRMRLRVGGVDNSTASNYIFASTYWGSGGSTGVQNSTGQTYWHLSEFYRRTAIVSLDIARPFATDYTTFQGTGYTNDSSTAQFFTVAGGGSTVTTSYDGFTIFPDTNTITGTVRVYGYNQ
jgi:hypothetical protein